MWIYYQTVEHGRQAWELTSSDQEKVIRKEKAYHMSIYWLDNLPESTEVSDIRYKGDFWVDIDHKPKAENPTEEETDESISKSISDINRLLDYLVSIKVDINLCRVFASGSKGFHLCVPGRIMGAGNAYKNLPKMHKEVAAKIQTYAEIEGMDLSLYAVGKGKLLRVENKQRSNGKYKVPITPSEARIMTPTLYWDLTSAPRPEVIHPIPKGTINQELAILFDEARDTVKWIAKASFETVPSEKLEPFIDSPPTCVKWITENINIVDKSGKFNSAKMSLSRYLMSAPISDDARHDLTLRFANSWSNKRFNTVEGRVREVRSAANFGREHGFSCEMISKGFTQNPCKDCPIKEEQRASYSEKAGVEPTPEGYFRAVAKGKGSQVTNFTLKPICKYLDEEDSDVFKAYDYEVYETRGEGEPEVTGLLTLDYRSWLSASEFKKQIGQRGMLIYIGTDTDLQHLKAYLTSPAMDSGVKVVKSVRTLGVFHHVDKTREIDEYVWVEPNWSINSSKVSNTVRFAGQRRENNGNHNNVTLPMRSIKALNSTDVDFNKAFKALLSSNNKSVVGPVIGWMCACWLKPHLMRGSDRHFPVLQIYGSSGAGKTETVSLHSLLAGSDYYHNGPLVVSGSTPYAIVAEATLTTSVPRILDEVNEHKIANKTRYMAAREAIKAASSGGIMPQGTLGTNNHRLSGTSVQVEERPVTSPLIMLATQINPEKEIEQRTVCLQLDQKFKGEDSNEENFLEAREHAKDLWPLAKALMSASLSTDKDWVYEKMKDNKKMLPEGIVDRPAKNWQVVLTGLDFLVTTLQSYRIDPFLVEETGRLKDAVIGFLTENQEDNATKLSQQEVDTIIDKMGEMATITDINGDKRLKKGLHYIVQGTTLHIFSTACFIMYVRYMRESGRVPELSDIKQFRGLLTYQPYFLGEGLAPDVSVPKDWFSFNLPELEKRGVNVERFTAE